MIRYITILVLLCLVEKVHSQGFIDNLFNENYDSIYYDKLDNKLTTKFFLSRKYSDFELTDQLIEKDMEYRSNPRFSVGLGATYKWLGLNLAIGMKNPDDSLYGSTSRFDLQTQLNLRKLTINFYTARYQGYYLYRSHELLKNWSAGDNYIRPDILSQTYGLSAYYIFNSSRYSNRATFLQNEWQQKSAGSLLAGATIFYNNISADSSLIPSMFISDTSFRNESFNKTGYFGMSGNLGYGFTLVLWRHWFFDLSILGGITSGFTKIENDVGSKKNAFKPGFTLLSRFGIGFNSNNFYAGLNTSVLRSNSPLPIEDTQLGFNVGVVRFLLAYRFSLNPNGNFLTNLLPEKINKL